MQLDCDTPPSLHEPLFHSTHHTASYSIYSFLPIHADLRSSSFLPRNHDRRFQGLSLSRVILDASVSTHVLPLILSPGPETPSSVIPVLSEPPSPATTHVPKAVLCMNSRSRVGQSSKVLINVHSISTIAFSSPPCLEAVASLTPVLSILRSQQELPCIDASAYRLLVASQPTTNISSLRKLYPTYCQVQSAYR